MNCSIIVASFGSDVWAEMARECAYCSANEQPAAEVILRHDPDATLAQVRNAAAADARGEWLCFLDADDELAPGYLDAMERAARPNALLGPAAEWVPWQRPAPKYRGVLGPICDMRDANWLVIGTLVERKLFYKVGGFKEWPVYEDWDLWQRCIIAGAEVVPVPDALYIAWAQRNSRNRRPQMRQKNDVHHQIRRTNHPELYEEAG